MKKQPYRYRRNFWLIITFVVFASTLFAIALGLARNYVRKVVENEFVGKKVDVLEHNIQAYNDLFFNRIPEVSFYQGYLDSAGASVYADSILSNYGFVKQILFYDVYLSHAKNGLGITPKIIYLFSSEHPQGALIYQKDKKGKLDLRIAEEFNGMASKLVSFMEIADTTRNINNEEINQFFYTVIPGKIIYMNIPRKEDVKAYKKFMDGDLDNTSVYEHDIFSYQIDPTALVIQNNHPELYERVEIKPLFYSSLDTDPDLLTTESPLPGALASYKLYFSANRSFLTNEVNKRFLPLAMMIALGYVVLFIIGYLIYRNISFNHRMFQLQYDFVNNLTHEFKTPVSVIKIAGSNIVNAKELNEEARKHYGKILDQEADKLNNLLNTLLSFTQIENKAIKLKQEQVNIAEFCATMVNSYRLKYPDFHLEYEIKQVKTLITDQVLLGSVFQNLIDNAYKYSKVGNKFLKIIIFKQKRQIIFKFVDKGIGIPKSEQSNIFKKFYRVKSQFNQQGSVGLGLAFCKELINFMDGDIQVKSVVGKGSTFLVYLPYIE